MDLEFLPIDLDRHAALCVAFAEDLDVCSFGSTEQLHGEDGKGAERYIQRLRAKLAADPEGCLHVWLGGTVVGQLNFGRFIDPSVGYIGVFYVIPEWRGKGVANAMEQYATEWFKRRGFASARLILTPSNVRAMRFYLKSGWRDLGPREDKPDLHNMRRPLWRKALSNAVTDLDFRLLPSLPQTASLKRVAIILWADEDVVALWLGGSFARREADEYSDLDLRVAVRPEAEERWRQPNLELLFGGEVVGSAPFPLGRGLLHHLALTNGDIYDLWVQTTEEAPAEDAALVLGCRDETFAQKLTVAKLPSVPEPVPADPAAVRQIIVSFWINSLKHRKVLHRGLNLVAQTGVGMERALIQRLWFIAATGRDGVSPRPTIHTLTELDHVVMGTQGMNGLSLTGGPLTSRLEIMRAIELNRDEVAALGRRLAADLGLDYPEALEQTVRETWRQYLVGAPKEHEWAVKKLGAAAIITDERGHVLLVKHSYGKLNWEVPGGAADADETAAETAVREVREETGLVVTAERLTGMYYWAENDSHHFVYQCSIAHDGQKALSVSSETTDCDYFSPDALPRPISDFTVRRIQDALAGDSLLLPRSVGPRQWLE